MTLIVRHMAGRLAVIVAAIMAVITIEELLQKSQAIYVLVASGDLPFSRLLFLWLNLLPLIFYHSTPEIVSLGLAYGYYRWAETNETVVLKNAGMSGLQIARPGLITIAVFAVFCGVNSLWLMPPTWTNVEDIRTAYIRTVNPEILQPGSQQEIVPGLSIEFAHRLADGTLEDIVVFDASEDAEFRLLWAKSGQFIELDGRLVLRLERGAYHDHKGDQWFTADFDAMSLPVHFDDPAERPARTPGYYEKDVLSLLNPPPDIRADPPLYAAWLTEGHQRVTAPFMCIGAGLLVLGLLIPGSQGRTGPIVRLLAAIVSALAAAILPTPLTTVAIHHLEFLPCFYLLALVPAIVGAALLLRGDAPVRRRSQDRSLVEKPL